VQILEERVDKKFEEHKDTLATKEDIGNVMSEIAKPEARLTMRMFLFWIGQLGAVIAIIKFLL